jgi:hypothetical protein
MLKAHTGRKLTTRPPSPWLWLCSLLLGAAPALAGVPDLLLDGRFRVTAVWRAGGDSGLAMPVPLTRESGYFWFFAPGNAEVLVKLVDACEPFDRFWFFAAGLTDVEVELSVQDTRTGDVRLYRNPPGEAFRPIQDTDAFATCAAAGCGQGTADEIAATPRPDQELERLAIFMGPTITARDDFYQRVVAEVGQIRAQHAELAEVVFHPRSATNTILATYGAETAARIESGAYDEWDCLNAWYRATPQILAAIDVTILRFAGNFKPELLVADYAALPGLEHVEEDAIGFFPYFYPPLLCGEARGAEHHYFFHGLESGPDRQFVVAGPGAPPVERTPADAASLEACVARDTPGG